MTQILKGYLWKIKGPIINYTYIHEEWTCTISAERAKAETKLWLRKC